MSQSKSDRQFDVIVVGAGNAALAAAVAAREAGAGRVVVLEKASEEHRGGNTRFSGGLLRFAYDSAEQVLEVAPEAKDLEGFLDGIDPYPASAFRSDLRRMTEGRTDADLSEVLIGKSYETVRWMAGLGIAMEPAVSLGGIVVDGKIKWPKGAVIRAVHEGVGLSETWFRIAQEKGVEIRYGHAARSLLQDDSGRVCGVQVASDVGIVELSARSVVLGAGGFEANAAWRGQYLGAPWDHAKVRGTRHNQGDGLRMALEAGALPIGQWTGCHATPIDAAAADYGVLKMTDRTNRLSYPFGVMINRESGAFGPEPKAVGHYGFGGSCGFADPERGVSGAYVMNRQSNHLQGDPRARRLVDALYGCL